MWARTRTLVLVTTAAAVLASAAAAAPYPHQRPLAAMPLPQLAAWQAHATTHYRYVWRRWWRGHRSQASARAAQPRCAAVGVRMPRWVCWYAAAARWEARELAQTRARLVAAAAPAPAGHWRLWACITDGAYAGAPHEGDGYNGPYSGPLGMTTPWAGHYPQPGRDWVSSARAYVYATAEQEYAAHGYSSAWVYGQWPNTGPPCAAYL